MFEPIQKSIKRKERANPGVLFSTQVCFRAGEIIQKLLPEVQNRFKIISFKDGRLKIAVDDSIMLQQIRMREEEIKRRLRKKAKVKSLKITYSPMERLATNKPN